MSEIVMAIGLWFSVFLLATDPYSGKKKPKLIFFSAAAIGFSIFGVFQITDSGFWKFESFSLYMAIWIPLFTWANNTQVRAVISQHGESSLQRKYGPPMVKLELLEDRRLAKMIKVSRLCILSLLGCFIVTTTIEFM